MSVRGQRISVDQWRLAFPRSPRTVEVHIEIMRTFVRLRRRGAPHDHLVRKLAELESKYDRQFQVVFDAIRRLMRPEDSQPRRRIGFQTRLREKP